MQVVSFDQLSTADLCVDGVYTGGRQGNAGDDPFPRLLSISNQGGFRYRGTLKKLDMVVLTSSLTDVDWPDSLDPETGVLTYFGDNKKPGRSLHDTPRNGNELLRRLFDLAHSEVDRRHTPPILIFGNRGTWRDVIFLGLAVPGTSDLRSSEDLVAVWKNVAGRRFQNYRARFTVLDVSVVSRDWIGDIITGNPISSNAPGPWLEWIRGGRIRALRAARSVEYRTKAEQLPQSDPDSRILSAIHQFFIDSPHDFEKCAAAITKLLLPDITSLDLTRPSRDGGRDATGELRIGSGETSILVGFSLEAKCYSPFKGVGVREMSRLISRLRHRQFGILVTTSYVDLQTFREIREDAHPIIVVSGRDIIDLLRKNGHGDVGSVLVWLEEFRSS